MVKQVEQVAVVQQPAFKTCGKKFEADYEVKRQVQWSMRKCTQDIMQQMLMFHYENLMTLMHTTKIDDKQ